MRRILVIGHKTLGGRPLLDEVKARIAKGATSIHLLVPVSHPKGAFSEASLHATASKVLEEGLAAMRALDPTGSVEVTGEVGDANPVYAARVVWNHGTRFDEVIVSTLAAGPSRWLRSDVPRRLAKSLPVPVTHVAAEAARVGV
jgi:hypothetical protein